MKHSLSALSTVVLTLLAQVALSAPPATPSPSRYSTLSTDSPFTTKPVVVGIEAPNPLEDYALGGITPLAGGNYMVTLLYKKKPDERIYIPGNKEGFKLLEVRPGTKGPLSTTAMISNGTKTGLVSFDDKLLVIKANVAKPQPGQPGQPGQPNPNGQPMLNGQPVLNGQPQIQPPNPNAQIQGGNNGGGGNRPPRPRVVPVPPTR